MTCLTRQNVLRKRAVTYTCWDEQWLGRTNKGSLQGPWVPSESQSYANAIHDKEHQIEQEDDNAYDSEPFGLKGYLQLSAPPPSNDIITTQHTWMKYICYSSSCLFVLQFNAIRIAEVEFRLTMVYVNESVVNFARKLLGSTYHCKVSPGIASNPVAYSYGFWSLVFSFVCFLITALCPECLV